MKIKIKNLEKSNEPSVNQDLSSVSSDVKCLHSKDTNDDQLPSPITQHTNRTNESNFSIKTASELNTTLLNLIVDAVQRFNNQHKSNTIISTRGTSDQDSKKMNNESDSFRENNQNLNEKYLNCYKHDTSHLNDKMLSNRSPIRSDNLNAERKESGLLFRNVETLSESPSYLTNELFSKKRKFSSMSKLSDEKVNANRRNDSFHKSYWNEEAESQFNRSKSIKFSPDFRAPSYSATFQDHTKHMSQVSDTKIMYFKEKLIIFFNFKIQKKAQLDRVIYNY
jgi:hypothetical protein